MNKMTIKGKLLTLIVVSLVLLASILSIVAISNTKNALIEKSYNSLTAARDSKKAQIENFFSERVGDINVLAKSNNVKMLIHDLVYVHKVLNVQGTDKYPATDPLALEKIKEHEEFFQNYAKEYGYYDIFLICASHGHVMYTQAKESDLGANVGTGPLKDSALGEAWRKVRKTKQPVFIDMKPYVPSAGAPAMFLGAPVYVDGKFNAVLVFPAAGVTVSPY